MTRRASRDPRCVVTPADAGICRWPTFMIGALRRFCHSTQLQGRSLCVKTSQASTRRPTKCWSRENTSLAEGKSEPGETIQSASKRSVPNATTVSTADDMAAVSKVPEIRSQPQVNWRHRLADGHDFAGWRPWRASGGVYNQRSFRLYPRRASFPAPTLGRRVDAVDATTRVRS